MEYYPDRNRSYIRTKTDNFGKARQQAKRIFQKHIKIPTSSQVKEAFGKHQGLNQYISIQTPNPYANPHNKYNDKKNSTSGWQMGDFTTQMIKLSMGTLLPLLYH